MEMALGVCFQAPCVESNTCSVSQQSRTGLYPSEVSVERAQITNLQEKQQILNIFAHRDLNEQARATSGPIMC